MEFDWTQLGVNTTLVTLVIGLTQFLKSQVFPQAPGFVFMVATMAISAAIGFFTVPEGGGLEGILTAAFTYATASAWLYNVAKRTPGLNNLFKDGQELKKSK